MISGDGGAGASGGVRVRVRLCERAAAASLARLHDERGRLRAPIPVEELITAEGFGIVRLGGIRDAVAGLVSVPDRIIAVNGRHHPHRQRFSLAHELAHILLRHPPEERCSALACRAFNREADLCASHLLMPPGILRGMLAKGASPASLALLFDVSLEAVDRRLREYGESP